MTATPATRHLDLPGGRIAYDDTEGAGPLILCLPGLGDTRGVFRHAAPLLVAAGYRVVTADLRGAGESSADWASYNPEDSAEDAIALLRHLGAGPAIVVGTSFTGASVLWIAAEAPELVAGIVLSGPFIRDIPKSAVIKAAEWLVGRTPALWLAYWKTLFPTRKPADHAAYAARLKTSLKQPGHLAALQAMLASSRSRCENRAAELTRPALVLMGTKDSDFKDPAAEARLVAERTHGTVVMVDGSGHYPQAEFPDAWVAAVAEFAAKTAA